MTCSHARDQLLLAADWRDDGLVAVAWTVRPCERVFAASVPTVRQYCHGVVEVRREATIAYGTLMHAMSQYRLLHRDLT